MAGAAGAIWRLCIRDARFDAKSGQGGQVRNGPYAGVNGIDILYGGDKAHTSADPSIGSAPDEDGTLRAPRN
jgi:hypothetical protein